MKRFLPFILIAAFLFPSFGHAAAAPATTTIDLSSPQMTGLSLAAKQTLVSKGLLDIYTQLTTFSTQTQVAITQLDNNGLDTTKAQTDILAANTSLTKAKAAMDAFNAISTKNSGTFTLDMLKYTANTAETNLHDTKGHLIDTLTDLKALLPTLDTSGQS